MPTVTITCLPPVDVDWRRGHPASVGQGPVSIFRLRISRDPAIQATWFDLLQPNEQQRADRYRQPDDRLRFLFGRGLFRLIASELTRQSAQSIPIETQPGGKPFIATAPNWHLSVSHAQEWVVLAVGQVPIGIDIEFVNPLFDYELLLDTVMSPAEQEAIRNHPDSRQLFFEFWTRKEAFAKATGKGMDDDFIHAPALEGRQSVDGQSINQYSFWRTESFFIDSAYPVALSRVYIDSSSSLLFYDIDPAQFTI